MQKSILYSKANHVRLNFIVMHSYWAVSGNPCGCARFVSVPLHTTRWDSETRFTVGGSPDPALNLQLAAALKKAKDQGVPKENIAKALTRVRLLDLSMNEPSQAYYTSSGWWGKGWSWKSPCLWSPCLWLSRLGHVRSSVIPSSLLVSPSKESV